MTLLRSYTAKTYEHNLLEEKSVVDRHRYNMAANLLYLLMKIIAAILVTQT